MKLDAPASDLERRKHVRLRLRGDLGITPQKYEGRTYYVVKDPVSLRYYRFKEQEHFLIRLMDGRHTLEEAQKAFEARFRPERLTLEDLEQFGQQLLTAGLVQNESPQAGQQLWDRRKKRRRMEVLQSFTNILYIKIPIFDPEKLLTRMLPYFRWMFTMWFLLGSTALCLGAVLLVATHFDTFVSRLPSYHEFFSFRTVFYLWAALGVVKVIHEFGHGLSCKAFGGEVHEMGLLFLCLSPAMYCNVSDAWTMPSKWHRIIISGAGIFVELVIAAIATFVWWNTPGSPFVNNMALSLMIVCSVSTVVFNGNPLMRFDGYYVLADWLEIPNLRERSNRYVQRLAMEHLLGIEVLPEPYMERWRRIFFACYAVLAYIYRWVITFVILSFLANFLRPYKLEIVSKLLTLAAVGSMIGWPVYRLIKNYNKRGRLPDMKPARVTFTSCLFALLLLGFFFLPLPVSRIRESGLVQADPGSVLQVHIEETGTLRHLRVREGDYVERGKVLAEFSSLEVDIRRGQAQTEVETKTKLVDLYRKRIGNVTDPQELLQMKEALVSAQNDLHGAEKALQEEQQKLDRLTLRAPRAGYVVGLPRIDEVGKLWKKDQPKAFCTITDIRKLRVLVPLDPADYDLLRQNLAKIGPSRDLPVTIRVEGRGNHTWKGQVNLLDLPSSDKSRLPLSLTSKGGGPLAVKPQSDPNAPLEPQRQVYLVPIDFTEQDEAICPGTMAQVKIHCEYRSCAWWTWRQLSLMFDLGLW